jgi:hypothetical protein
MIDRDNDSGAPGLSKIVTANATVARSILNTSLLQTRTRATVARQRADGSNNSAPEASSTSLPAIPRSARRVGQRPHPPQLGAAVLSLAAYLSLSVGLCRWGQSVASIPYRAEA